jgi:regulator of ribonuclease activity A
MSDFPTSIHDECTTQAGMCNDQPVLTVNGHPIGPAGAKEGAKNPHLADRAVRQQGATPDCIATGEDVDLIRQAVNQPGHDQVLVIDGGGSTRRALFGDVMAAIAVKNGWSGVIINGAIRDVSEIMQMSIGVKALGTNPRRGERTGIGRRDIPVTFGGVTFTPGSRLVADTDGLVVLPPHMNETDVSVADTVAQTAAYVAASQNSR